MTVLQMNLDSPQSLNPNSQLQPPGHALLLEEQVGKGRRLTFPPSFQTPTCLHSKVKATERNTGLVRHASSHRHQMLADVLSILSEGSTEEATGSAEQSNPNIECASHLFARVASQSLFLTCRMQTTGTSLNMLGDS